MVAEAIRRAGGTAIMDPAYEVDSARLDGDGFLTRPTPEQFIDELNQRARHDQLYKQLESAATARLVPTATSPAGYEIFDGAQPIDSGTPGGLSVVSVFSTHFQALWNMYGGCA